MVFRKNVGSTFIGRSETKLYQFRLEGGNRRWQQGKNQHVRYVFTGLSEEPLPEDGSVITLLKSTIAEQVSRLYGARATTVSKRPTK